MGDVIGKKAAYYPANTTKEDEALYKLKREHNVMDNPWFTTGESIRTKKDIKDEEYAKNKLLNSNEEEQEVQKQRRIDQYPKGTSDDEGYTSRSNKEYGKEYKGMKKGGKVSASSRADGCAQRGKTRGRYL